MADAAAFFASKKSKKKKAFKFNANLVAPASVTSTVHVDAPALSTDQDVIASNNANIPATIVEQDKEWDDEALAKTAGGGGVPTNATAELGTLSLDAARTSEADGIAEKLRVEETKKQLAAARVGMEKTMAKEKEESAQLVAKKAETRAANAAPRFSAAAAQTSMGGSGGGGKWVPPQLRGGGGMGLRGRMPGSTGSTKLDVADEELFPDLASADKILENTKVTPAFRAPKKTAVGGGATWATPKKPVAAKAPKIPKGPKVAATTTPAVEAVAAPEAAAAAPMQEQAPAASTAAATGAAVKKVPIKKKKKKDLSTFKPSA